MNEQRIKSIGALVAVLGLLFSLVKFVQVQEIEAARPYLEKKLSWCVEAVETAATIANSENGSVAKEKRFWELYWGVMAMVEREEITQAMIGFGNGIKTGRQLKAKSLAVAHACRQELARDWSPHWSF